MSDHARKTFAKRSLGQNFLVDQNYIQKIIDALEPRESDTIIEIGPGRGAITGRLVESGANVIAIELDRDLVPVLQEQFKTNSNFKIVEEDALNCDFEKLLRDQRSNAIDQISAKVVANLPYNVSTAILQRLAEQSGYFSSLVLMFQREVVDRITALPGNSERGYFTVIVEAAFAVEKLFDVPPNAFRPVPKVWSSVVVLTPKPASELDDPAFHSIVATAFAQKRKTIFNNLKSRFNDALDALERAGIDPKRRAETLDLDEWLRLFRELR